MAASDNALRVRAELFSGLIEHLNQSGIRYCILGGFDRDEANAGSDIDLMVDSRELARMPGVMANVAEAARGKLVQAIWHETSACYFVLAKRSASYVGFLNPDCTGDYRRDGRLWLRADDVLSSRCPYRDFYVPSCTDQFIYLFIKRVLKQAISPWQLRRLRHLYQRDPRGCRARMSRFFSHATIRQVEKAFSTENGTWFEAELRGLLTELRTSPPIEGIVGRAKHFALDVVRVCKRIYSPTGLIVAICGGRDDLRKELASRAMAVLAPLFRWTRTVSQGPSHRQVPGVAARMYIRRLRSTLVVATTPGPAQRKPAVLNPDLTVVLRPRNLAAAELIPALEPRGIVYVDPDEGPENGVDWVTDAVVSILSNRVLSQTNFSREVLLQPSFESSPSRSGPYMLSSTDGD